MSRFADWAQSFVLSLGAPGLFVISFIDSSFLSLPEINDLLLVWMVTEDKPRMPIYAAASTLGSMAGCLVLYSLGRKGGDALVRRRFNSARVEHALGAVRRFGVWALVVPSLFPPPAPFKIFVLLSGVAGMRFPRFIVAIGVGRGTRYFGEGLLALWYGDQAMAFIQEHARVVALVIAITVVAALAGYLFWTKAPAAADR
jgi:membrane protein YqaA with SNARE-associated domain